MNDDDDLPVLTQVLRTGTRRPFDAEHPDPRADRAVEPPALEVTPVHETLMADQLVIGNAPHGGMDPYLASLVSHEVDDLYPQEDATPAVSAANDRRGPDSFRLPQDHDGGRATHHDGTAFDEPEMTTAVPVDGAGAEAHVDARAASSSGPRMASSVGPPVVAVEDPVAFARRIRDAVIENLSARIETELDARIAQAIHAEVETALAHLQDRLRVHLTEALHDVVGRAVDEEIARSR